MSFFESDGRYYDVNFFEYFPENIESESLPASALFFEAVCRLSLADECLDFACKARKWFGLNKILWGIRKDESGYSLEFYFYYPSKYPKNSLSSVMQYLEFFFGSNCCVPEFGAEFNWYLTSVNLTGGMPSDVNIYRSLIDSESEIFLFEDKGFAIDRYNPRFCSFSLWSEGEGAKKMNDYWGYFDGNIMHRLLAKVYVLASAKFPAEPPLKSYDFLKYAYGYGRSSVFNNALVAEKNDAIGLYFLHLNIDEFIAFLSIHNYEIEFIDYMKSHKLNFSHMLFDVGLDFYLLDGVFHIKKTAFWGSL